jgi:hypothetical protein
MCGDELGASGSEVEVQINKLGVAESKLMGERAKGCQNIIHCLALASISTPSKPI